MKLKYKNELVRSMEYLSRKKDTIFLGQSVSYSGNAIFNTLTKVKENKKIELPVAEDMQMGMSIGLAMNGYVPITCYPRFDFLVLAFNQLVNHLDKMKSMTNSQFKPKVIIRTSVGSKKPLNGGVQHTQDYTEIFKKTLNGYQNLAKKHPNLNYNPLSLKKSTWSLGLTYMGYSGYYNPFTGEAQVNGLIKLHKFPVVSCHEQAHQLGYAAENEANFIAALATINNEDEFIQYTGYIFALRYCVNEIASRDLDTYRELLTTINPGILKSYKEMRDFWRSYENPFEVISKLFWDQFLKANNQSKGIKSYNYMVALIINYYENQQF